MPVELPLSTGRPKRDIIEMAHQYCGIDIDTLSVDEMTRGLRTLNFMMLEPPFNRIEFDIPPYGDGDLADQSGIADTYTPAVVLALAARIAPSMGKTLSAETRASLAQAMGVLRAGTVEVPELAAQSGLPLGLGARQYHTASGWTEAD